MDAYFAANKALTKFSFSLNVIGSIQYVILPFREYWKIKNIGILIFCLICIFFGLTGVTVLVTSAYLDPAKYAGILNLLSSIGSLLGGFAGAIAAVAAYQGVESWKKQLKFGKHISLVWSCMESVRNLQRRISRWYPLAFVECTSGNQKPDDIQLYKKQLDAATEELISHFHALDKIVVKNKWQWANYANDLVIDISNLTKVFKTYKGQSGNSIPLMQELKIINSSLENKTKSIEVELEKLESKYQ